MHIEKAVITAAGRSQRTLPVQTLYDRDGTQKSVLRILVEEALSAGIEEIAVIVAPGDEKPYADVIREHASRLHFIPQVEARGYGHAVLCAHEFTGTDPFLHLVGDHLYVSHRDTTCARELVDIAVNEECAVSAVQATRETLLPYYGAIGGRRIAGRRDLYMIERVLEKPTPTDAELNLMVPGLRAGHYLCFFGIHVLTPTVMENLTAQFHNLGDNQTMNLSDALASLATQEKYLAYEMHAQRFDVGVRYGLLTAQLALALNGKDRNLVLTRLVEMMASREIDAYSGSGSVAKHGIGS